MQGAWKKKKKLITPKKATDKKDAGKSKQHRPAISTLWSKQRGRSKAVTKRKTKRSSAIQALRSRQYKKKASRSLLSEKGAAVTPTVKSKSAKQSVGRLARRARGGFGARVSRRARAQRKRARRNDDLYGG